MAAVPDVETLVYYRDRFPNEAILALCLKESRNATIRPFALPFGDYEFCRQARPAFVIFFSDYLSPEEIDWLKRASIGEVLQFSGTSDFLEAGGGKEDAGNWAELETPQTAAWLAYMYVKSLPREEIGDMVSRARTSLDYLRTLAEKGRFFLEKEQADAKAIAGRVVLVSGPTDTPGLSFTFSLVSLGAAPGIMTAHTEVMHAHPDVDFSLIHYTTIENDELVDRWSTRGRKRVVADRIFTEILECETFGPPLEQAKVSAQRGGGLGVGLREAIRNFRARGCE